MTLRTLTIALTALFLLGLPSAAALPVPDTLTYQAYLTDAAGAPINDTVGVVFRLYDVETGGVELWSQEATVFIEQGLFSVELGGAASPFPATLFDQPLWLGITIGTDGEMLPRRALSSSAFTFRAAKSDTVADGAVTAASLAPGAVTAVSIAPGAVSADNLAAGAVTLDTIGVACAPGETLVNTATGWECGSAAGVECIAGDFLNCYTGPMDTLDVGLCQAGRRTCEVGGSFGTCMNETTPAVEICDELDNDCNGLVDDGLDCRACTDQQAADVSSCSVLCGVDLSCFNDCTTNAGVPMECVNAVNMLGLCAFANDCGMLEPLENPGCIATNCLQEYEAVYGELLPECSPGAIEVCYDGPPGTEGIGQCTAGLRTCSAAGFFEACSGQILPGPELCDGIDNDCNDQVDNDPVDAIEWFPDVDGDGYGAPDAPIVSCTMPVGYTDLGGDCNDNVTAINPGAAEICDDLIDNDCDGDFDSADSDCP